MLTALQAQCDSAVSVCPNVFDRLIKNDVLAVQYKAYAVTLIAENDLYEYALNEKDSTIQAKVNELALEDQEDKLTDQQLKQTQEQLSRSQKENKRFRFGIYLVGLAGIISTIYFIIH